MVCEAAEGGRRQSERGDSAMIKHLRFETALVHRGLGHLGKGIKPGLSERLGLKGWGPRACSIQGRRPTERWSRLCKATLVSSWPQDSELPPFSVLGKAHTLAGRRDVWAIHLSGAGLEGSCEATKGFCPPQQCWSGGAQRLL
uniref:Uncharacterized protein n=1 Tax=Nomascus leucogenys TaxID=61853 RepID=A0A2I3I003_NOMLE